MLQKQILIVDDQPDVRAIAKLGLEMGAGWQVITACCGQEAINLAANHQPDAILLDMMMPDMDGRVTLEYLKSNPNTQNIPVILVTAKAQQWERENFSGMDVAAVKISRTN
jgi:CheY-like chemotaxis protein